MKVQTNHLKVLAERIKKAGTTQEQAKQVLKNSEQLQARIKRINMNPENSAMDKIGSALKKLNII